MRLLSTLLLACLLLAPSWASADRSRLADPRPVEPRFLVAQRGCTSLGEAVEQVRRQYGGRIVSAETRRRGNRETHVIRVMTEDGQVKTVNIPGCPVGQG